MLEKSDDGVTARADSLVVSTDDLEEQPTAALAQCQLVDLVHEQQRREDQYRKPPLQVGGYKIPTSSSQNSF